VLVGVGVAVVAWVLAVNAGLVGGDQPAMDDTPRTLNLEGAPSTTDGARPGTVAYRLEPAGGPATTVRLEVAADPASRARGLMGRTKVPEGDGDGLPVSGRREPRPFWMKNTLVPLSIAFVAADGRVVSVAEMTPCKADPCPTYAPAGPYRYAVELAAGSFGAAGVGPGAKVVPRTLRRCPNQPETGRSAQDKVVLAQKLDNG
jgi:uncharacterized membrane protein (UPF0127 family)